MDSTNKDTRSTKKLNEADWNSVIRMIQTFRNEKRKHVINVFLVISRENLLKCRHNIEKKESLLIPISKLKKLDILSYK